MPNAAETIERLAAELELYKLFAAKKGYPTKEDVTKAVLSAEKPEDKPEK